MVGGGLDDLTLEDIDSTNFTDEPHEVVVVSAVGFNENCSTVVCSV